MTENTDILQAAFALIDRLGVGVLSTVDAQGRPFSRWMGAVATDRELSPIYSVTAKETRKVTHLRGNHAVCWLFSDAQTHETVTVYGQASLHETTVLPVDAWHRLTEFTDPYAMNAASDRRHHAYLALITQVTAVEHLHPAAGQYQPRTLDLA